MIIGSFVGFTSGKAFGSSHFNDQRIVHIDMNGAPPRADYLEIAFPKIREMGATGLLIEWHDMLPFTGKFESLRSQIGYSSRDVKRILKSARLNGLKVIPLVNTICCHLDQESDQSTLDLLDQIIALHPGIDSIHLGGNSMFSIGDCEGCTGDSKVELVLQHIIPILNHIKLKGLNVLMWDDMVRRFSSTQRNLISNLVEIVVYHPEEDITQVPNFMETWKQYNDTFPKIWGASAFKGAEYPESNIPNLIRHKNNQNSWITFERNAKIQFNGVILVGWSHISPAAPLCQLLPSSIPSLALSLAVLLSGGYTADLKDVVFTDLDLYGMPLEKSQMIEFVRTKEGNFPGSKVFQLIAEIEYMNVSFPISKQIMDKPEYSALPLKLQKELDPVYNPKVVNEILSKAKLLTHT